MSLAISIVVIVCMAISFAALFLLYGRTKAKGVKFGVEDKQLTDGLADRLHRCGKKGESGLTYTQMLENGKRKERIIRIVTDAVLFVFIAVVGALTVFSFVLRAKGEQIYFGDTAYITVLTSSMQDKNEDNEYLKENDDGVRIHQYALIGIDKCDPATLKAGDIIAFKYEGDIVYIHRIVAVREKDGEKFFTTMGDANSASLPNETDISADRIVGVFNGFHKGYLGVLLVYMRSDIGMIALIFVFLLLVVIDLSEWLITRSYEKREEELAGELDRPKRGGGEGGSHTPNSGYQSSVDYLPADDGGYNYSPSDEYSDYIGYNDNGGYSDYDYDYDPQDDYGDYSDYGDGYGQSDAYDDYDDDDTDGFEKSDGFGDPAGDDYD